ncbi:MAG: hypothetical protein M3N16_01975 [Actinomycetota bacterium]|nr:hypothetical protein [Actinomycetota bacterium]
MAVEGREQTLALEAPGGLDVLPDVDEPARSVLGLARQVERVPVGRTVTHDVFFDPTVLLVGHGGVGQAIDM